MSRIVLIHGFATGIRFSIFNPAKGEDAGFTAFRDDIASGEASAFRWDIKENASFFESLNPSYTWNIYRREKTIAENRETFRRLAEFLQREQPEVIVCHSMGCFLLSGYLQNESLPPSVRHIVFNQSDLPRSGRLSPAEGVTITNTFCFWDVTLWFSSLMSGSFRSGLFGAQDPSIRNLFFPLVKPINLHTAAIRSKRFRNFIKGL